MFVANLSCLKMNDKMILDISDFYGSGWRTEIMLESAAV
ncbi:hypothetical protein AC062_0145 [Pasteurellaceae bacterium NI1060]|nr:hypothetical protein AC062_0145 [Pasteurellaceae bacterium NI1060]